jgi:hypothetical protein
MIWRWIKKYLSDPDSLFEALTAYQADCERNSAPIRDRMKVLDGLLEENKEQLNRLLDLYLSGGFKRDLLTDRKNRIEATIQSLEREHETLASRLANQTLSDERLRRIMAFAERQADKVELASQDFDVRRAMIEELDVRATVVRENEEIVAYATCILGEEALRIPAHTTSGGWRPTVKTGWTFTCL